jgi:hypothetical protein
MSVDHLRQLLASQIAEPLSTGDMTWAERRAEMTWQPP